MDKNRPSFYAILPADVRYDEELAPNAKLFYAEITALAEKKGYCFADNEYFTEVYGFSDRTVSRLIAQLEKCGYIIRQILRDKDGKVSQRRLYLKASIPHGLPPDNFGSERQNCQDETDKIGGCNTTSLGSKKESKKKKPKAESLTDEQLQSIFKDWIKAIAPESWSNDIKNRLWKSLCDFYSPRIQSKNNPERSVAGVNALKRQLMDYSGGYPEKMCMILDTSLSRGYRGIIQLDDNKKQPSSPQPVTAGGDYVEF